MDPRKAYNSVPCEALWIALQKLGVPEAMIDLVKSFHSGMRTRVRVDGTLLDDFDVSNGLRQDCTMAPTLFNLNASIVSERWLHRVEGLEGVGTLLLHKLDQKLFHRATRNAQEVQLYKGEFADDVVLLACSRQGAVAATQAYVDVVSSLGLTVSFSKTKFLVTGCDLTEEDRMPLVIDDNNIECVSEFPYLDSLIADSGRLDVNVENRIASASKVFGALRHAVFDNSHLSTVTKRHVYGACVLSVLIYGSECWVPLKNHQVKLFPSQMS